MYHELRAADFRAIFRLLGECGELWCDPAAWQRHLLAGLSEMIHLPVGMHATVSHFAPGETPRVHSGCEHGWADAARQARFRERMRGDAGPFHLPFDRRFRQRAARRSALTLSRADVFSCSEWRRSESFHEVYRPARLEELLTSAMRTGPDHRFDVLGFGGSGHLPTSRDCQIVGFLHRELLPLIGTRLATGDDFSRHGLSPRRRQVLELALAGLPEKEIADRLALRPATVNESLQAIYAHFAVHTRAQLMAYFLARRPAARPNG
jgi:DNA-binding CsgD family transcriptional regulator